MAENAILLSTGGHPTMAQRRGTGGVIITQSTSHVLLNEAELEALWKFVGATPQLGRLQRFSVVANADAPHTTKDAATADTPT